MSKTAKALSIEQSMKLLPAEFHPAERLFGRKMLIQTSKGLLSYHSSSLLNGGLWITSHNEDEIRNEIDFVLFAISYEGIFILSRNVLTSFYDKNYKSRFNNNGYPITVYKEANRYYWRGERGARMDITQYFYPNK